VKQVEPFTIWPSGSGWTIGVLRQSPADLTAKYGIQFHDGLDDLDRYALAAVVDPIVGQLWLFRHAQAPMPGAEVLVDTSVSRSEAVAAVERQFGLGSDEYEWLTPAELSPLTAGLAAPERYRTLVDRLHPALLALVSGAVPAAARRTLGFRL
jgi:hypothetical protein